MVLKQKQGEPNLHSWTLRALLQGHNSFRQRYKFNWQCFALRKTPNTALGTVQLPTFHRDKVPRWASLLNRENLQLIPSRVCHLYATSNRLVLVFLNSWTIQFQRYNLFFSVLHFLESPMIPTNCIKLSIAMIKTKRMVQWTLHCRSMRSETVCRY